jgi:hypothetical protein
MMKKILIFISLIHISIVFAQSPDPVILSYQRNFIRASITTKIELLNDASRITTITMTPLYIDALNFVNVNYPVLGTDSQLMDLAVIAATKAASYQDISVLPVLRSVFSSISETRIKIACLNTFSILAKGQKTDISFLNAWFSDSLASGPNGTAADVKTLASCATALGKIADASSFSVLFKAATGTLDSSVVSAAAVALNSISDSYTENILAIIAEKRIRDMYAAFSFAMKKSGLSDSDKGRIAEAAFAASTDSALAGADGNAAMQAALVRESLDQLSALKWSPASPQVVKYFYQKQGDYTNDKVNIEILIPVIKCMGAMGTTDSAQALSIFLGLLNSETEQKKTYNEQLMLAVIQALGDLGDKTAFDYLLYVGYLDYPETVKKASRDALARLQW